MSWRKNVFEKGALYRAKQTFVSGPSEFSEGELLTFEADSYSHYDNSSVFQFRNATTKELKGWWLHDSESVEIWKNFFTEETEIDRG
jgi:hypothetical protein